MFVMTCDISVGSRTGIKPNAVKWKCATSSFMDTCSITLPLAPYVTKTQNTTFMPGSAYVTSTPFQKGDKVVVKLGYDGRNEEVFRGFVSRINYTERLVLECEGYSYQLRDLRVNKSYSKTTIKQLLQELVAGTDILLSPKLDDIPLSNVWFKNAPALKVLEFLQKECCCRVWFDGQYLYAGASKFVHPNPERTAQDVRLQVGWNIINANELKKAQSDDVQIIIVEKDSKGSVKKTKSEQRKYSSDKEVKVRAGLPQSHLQRAVQELQNDENYGGYEGKITCFLVPQVYKSDKVIIEDKRFPERSGNYFAESVEGSFDERGGRQQINLQWYGNA